MKSTLPFVLGISCFVLSGNSQDEGETVSYGPAATAYNTQGNVAYNRSQAERELDRAAQEARALKELMYSRAALNGTPPPPPPRTAAEFLAANKPPPPPPSDSPKPPVRTSRDYVPTFETGGVNTPAPAPVTTDAGLDMRKQEKGLFKQLFQSRKKAEETAYEAPVGASEYRNPYTPETSDATAPVESADSTPAPSVEPDSVAMENVLDQATVSELPDTGSGKPGFFGKLFGKKNEGNTTGTFAEPPSAPAGAATGFETGASETPGMTVAETPPAPSSSEIPDPAGFNEEPPAAPTNPESAPVASTPPEPAPIFQRRSGGTISGGSPATVSSESSASVNGVRVKLFPGTGVSVLSSSGGTSRIQLPDGRVGTIPSSSLAR